MAEQVTGYHGMAFDPATGRLRVVARLTAEFDVTLSPEQLRGVVDVAGLVGRAGGATEAEYDALSDAVAGALPALLARAVGRADGSGRLDLDRAQWTEVELSWATLDDGVGNGAG